MAINLKGQVVTQAEVKDCRGEGCPVTGCKKRKPASDNKCLGYRETTMLWGAEWKPWRCEHVKI